MPVWCVGAGLSSAIDTPRRSVAWQGKPKQSIGRAVRHFLAYGGGDVEPGRPPISEEFVKLVAEQDPKRAATPGAQPTGLLYVFHRSDKPWCPTH